MKIYLSVDMEGIAGVTHRDHTKLEGVEYEMARKWMTAETNAAIEGALAAGATEFVVADSHGHMRNILPDDLYEEALLVRGSPRPLTMMEGLDKTFDAAFFVGYHSMAGTDRGVLSHTYIGSSVLNVRLNGKTVGEPGFNAAIAGELGVPMALVCGDDTVEAEVAGLMPWTERVVTKWAISPTSAKNLTPKAAQKRIRTAAEKAVRRLAEMKPLVLDKPIRFEVDFMRPIYAALAADIPGVQRLNGRTLAYTGADMLEVTRIWRLIINSGLTEGGV
jgi:D-amino peptidase